MKNMTAACFTHFESPFFELLHKGKVRDSLKVDDKTRMIVVTDRISAFNKNLKTPIPNKGAILNSIANFWFEKTKSIIPNHLIQQVDPNISIVKEAEPIRVEMVVRGYLTGSMWRGYEKGERNFSGVQVGDGLVKNQAFPSPIITPTTKDKDDTAITETQIIERGLVSAEIYQQMKAKALELFALGTSYLADCGIVLVDTKYEFGLLDGELILIDEMHTPDSSRFWKKADYDKSPATAEQIDKEFVRQWMLANKIDGVVPDILSDAVIDETSARYASIYEWVTGNAFIADERDTALRIFENLKAAKLIPADADLSTSVLLSDEM